MGSGAGCARWGGVARRTASRGNECTGSPPTGSLNRVSFTRILTSVSPSCTQGRSRVREFRLHGFGRGAVSNDRPYRASHLLSLTLGLIGKFDSLEGRPRHLRLAFSELPDADGVVDIDPAN